MIYAGDLYLPLPVKDIYDTLMMLATVNAAKDMYEKGLKEMEEFNKKFGDFYSPINADMEWYDKYVTGNVRDVINLLYAKGIDPLRSPEARALISRVINNVPVGTVNKLKLSAAAAEEYLKARGQLETKGLYNPDFEDFMSNGNTLENWDTVNNGMWLRTSPYEFKTLKDATNDWYNNRTPGELSKEDVEAFGLKYNPRNKYTGFGYRLLMGIAEGNTPGWQGSVYADYYRNQARKQLLALGITNPSSDQIERQLQKNIAIANKEYLIPPTSKADEWAMLRQEHANKVALENLRRTNTMEEVKAKKGGSSSGDGGGSDTESLSDAQYQLMRGTANIIQGTMFGRNANISSYRDFSPEKFNGLLVGAQNEIADRFYDSNISGGGQATVRTNPKPMFVYDNTKKKMVSAPKRSALDLSNVNVSISPILPALNDDQRSRLQSANRSFIDAMSMDYTPAKFAKWTTRETDSSDDTMIMISNDDDAIRRLYSLDEIALNSAGVNRPQSDLDWARGLTDSSRKSLGKRSDNLYMKSTGTMFTHVERDGSVHIYQIVNIYKRKGKKGNRSFEKDPVGQMAYDMGITTYSNSNFGIAGDTSTNLYFDENVDADVRWSGDQSVLHWEHVGAPKINSTIAYPQLPWQQ